MENTCFQKALSDFTHEVASGGAIRHLTDLGYTVKQITGQLDFPTPYERVQKAVWERLKETGVILLEEPGSGGRKEKAEYVQERDKFGRTSFRRVIKETVPERVVCWKEQVLRTKNGLNTDREPDRRAVGDMGKNLAGDAVFAILQKKARENGQEDAYASCDFGWMAGKEPEQYREMLAFLEEPQREYVEGLSWERHRVYHKMNFRMMEVLEQLCSAECYQGECFFLKTQEKIRIECVF